MDEQELIDLIGRGEDSRTQLKQNVTNPESLAGDLTAFANAKGGRIIIGVNDVGSITGLSFEDVRRLNQLLANAATNLVRPSINPVTENITAKGRLLMVVTVPEGLSKPYCDNHGVFWVKSGSDKRRITSREEIQRLLQSAAIVYADELPVEGAAADEVDLSHFREFFEKRYEETLENALDRARISLIQLLRNLGLARNGALNLAGLLLFARNPQRFRPVFMAKAVSFFGTDPAGTSYRDSEDISGCLRDLFKGMRSFLTRNLRHVQGSKSFNTEGDLEVPVAALDELLVNMLLHRDYFISAPWRVFIFDDRVELISPGSLPNNLTIENIRNGVSIIRNPIIASFGTKELPYRGIGTGIRRALAAAPEIELDSDTENNLFTARIPRKAA